MNATHQGAKLQASRQMRRCQYGRGNSGPGAKYQEAGSVLASALARSVVQKAIADELNTGRQRQLVRNGQWCVPISERPAGWEKMGVREGPC